MGTVQIKRVYEAISKDDGKRILIDRLWPRGISKEAIQIDEWMKDIAPSTTLRKQFNHEPSKWNEFTANYTEELMRNESLPHLLAFINTNKVTTLLYAAHDEQHNHALVLQKFMLDLQKQQG